MAFVLYLFLAVNFFVLAQNCPATDYDCQIAQIQREIDALKPAHERNKEELANLKKQLSDLERRIAALSVKLKETEWDIEKKRRGFGICPGDI